MNLKPFIYKWIRSLQGHPIYPINLASKNRIWNITNKFSNRNKNSWTNWNKKLIKCKSKDKNLSLILSHKTLNCNVINLNCQKISKLIKTFNKKWNKWSAKFKTSKNSFKEPKGKTLRTHQLPFHWNNKFKTKGTLRIAKIAKEVSTNKKSPRQISRSENFNQQWKIIDQLSFPINLINIRKALALLQPGFKNLSNKMVKFRQRLTI